MYEIAPLLDDPIHNLKTIRDLYRWAVTELETSDLSFGHGSPSALEDASFLICRALKLPFENFDMFLDAALTHNELVRIVHLIDRRVHDKTPTAYLLKEAWLTEHRFYIDERALIPRSYIAELLEEDLAPWAADPEAVHSVLDLCTGSGCLAILAQGAFQNLQGRRFDIIISNPPYVTTDAMERLPSEYRHEPALALAAGADGMDVVRRILAEAADHLTEEGFIVVEVGDGLEAVEAAFPGLPITWLSVSGGDDQVFLAQRADLAQYFKTQH